MKLNTLGSILAKNNMTPEIWLENEIYYLRRDYSKDAELQIRRAVGYLVKRYDVMIDWFSNKQFALRSYRGELPKIVADIISRYLAQNIVGTYVMHINQYAYKMLPNTCGGYTFSTMQYSSEMPIQYLINA